MASKLDFDGETTRYRLWEIKFLSFLRLQKLITVIESNDTTDDGYEEKNANIITLLVKFLDDTSFWKFLDDTIFPWLFKMLETIEPFDL